MSKPLTADEILPLIACLSPQEKARLLRLIAAPPSPNDAYRRRPASADEFSGDEDQLAWDAEGWESVG
jgi:hypothetical protein